MLVVGRGPRLVVVFDDDVIIHPDSRWWCHCVCLQVSPVLKDFLGCMLTCDTLQRSSAADLLEHPFMLQAGSPRCLVPLVEQYRKRMSLCWTPETHLKRLARTQPWFLRRHLRLSWETLIVARLRISSSLIGQTCWTAVGATLGRVFFKMENLNFRTFQAPSCFQRS